jgi:pyruvate kinase
MRHTKIMATLGPASSEPVTVERLVAAGVDIFRLNFSHGTHDSHAEAISRIRRAAHGSGRVVAILQDLSGPKIRTGRLEDGRPLQLAAGDELRIRVGEFVGRDGLVSTTYAHLPRAVKPGDRLLLDDGHIQLQVETSGEHEVRARVVDGGPLGEHKGINAPGVPLPTSGLTPKDEVDLRFGLGAGVDMVAMSFVQRADDLQQLRTVLVEAGAPHIPIVAKLERPEAVARLDEVLHACDAVMVARGDLGLELPLEQVPRIQKQATRRARALGKPVIIATQVLESMRHEPRPTRAEVSDAANAVDDGVDVIMLAGETAAGAHPVRAVQMLDRIIREAETIWTAAPVALEQPQPLASHGTALCESAVTLASRTGAAAIVAVTREGKTARVLSALRPPLPIIAVTAHARTAARLSLCRGVLPLLETGEDDFAATAVRVGRPLIEQNLVRAGSTVVLVSVTPDLAPGPSNIVRVQRV